MSPRTTKQAHTFVQGTCRVCGVLTTWPAASQPCTRAAIARTINTQKDRLQARRETRGRPREYEPAARGIKVRVDGKLAARMAAVAEKLKLPGEFSKIALRLIEIGLQALDS